MGWAKWAKYKNNDLVGLGPNISESVAIHILYIRTYYKGWISLNWVFQK